MISVSTFPAIIPKLLVNTATLFNGIWSVLLSLLRLELELKWLEASDVEFGALRRGQAYMPKASKASRPEDAIVTMCNKKLTQPIVYRRSNPRQ